MHLEVMGEYWDGLFEEALEYYDAAGFPPRTALSG